MAGLPLLIVIIAALAATGLAAVGLQVFFRFLESSSRADEFSATDQITQKPAARRDG